MIAFKEFETLAQRYNVVPLERTMLADLLTPVSAYLTLRRPNVASFLFESVEPNEKIGRFSFVGTEPRVLVRSSKGEVTVTENKKTAVETGIIFEVLQRLSAQYQQAPGLKQGGFTGGFVGYIGYECVRHIEHLQLAESQRGDEDDAMLGLFDTLVRFDHREHLVTIISNVIIDKTLSLEQQYDTAKKKLEAIDLRLRNTTIATSNFVSDVDGDIAERDKKEFCDAVLKAKKHIVDGDVFQLVLSRKLQLEYSGDPFPVYRALRVINPSPYLFYLDFGETKLIGSSPEVLVRSNGSTVELLPIAGTRPRGKGEQEDLEMETELLHDEKELAEHLMLVDLGRNDVGRICDYGTVHVPVFKRVERYSHVMHLVSEVRGKLSEGKSPVDILKACFPAGTVSGAPKVRAMEIINELEKKRRGVYAGAVGYIGFDGTMDTCIAIRTIIAYRGVLKVQAGAGIVADSVPELEYQETVNKSRALIEAIKLAANGLQI
ncbi:MAG: anthranilate synthase component I [bacterium]